MPLPAMVFVGLTLAGSVVFLGYQIKTLRRRKRNLRHWERDEPLEGVNDWD
jgi:hypothetical protein